MTKLQRILHVEDDQDIREIAKLSLETLGNFDLLQCASGPEALERAPDFTPQLLLLDVMMPTMSGEETLAALRQLDGVSSCPAIFVTAKAQEDEIADLIAANNADGVIVKPFDPMTLPDQITALWTAALSGRAD